MGFCLLWYNHTFYPKLLGSAIFVPFVRTGLKARMPRLLWCVNGP